MMERELREGLAVALANEPELTFDPDTVVTRAKREAVRRKAWVGVGVTTALVALTSVVVQAVVQGHVAPAAPPLTATSAPTTTEAAQHTWPPAGVRSKDLDAATWVGLADGWTATMDSFVRRDLPAATNLTTPPYAQQHNGKVQPGEHQMVTDVTFTLHGGLTDIDVDMIQPGGLAEPFAQLCAKHHMACNVTWHGNSAVSVDEEPVWRDGGKLRTVTDFRPDGTVVSVTARNYDDVSGNAEPTVPDIPFSVAQLTSLAEDPALSF